jgi:hypothetical protein
MQRRPDGQFHSDYWIAAVLSGRFFCAPSMGAIFRVRLPAELAAPRRAKRSYLRQIKRRAGQIALTRAAEVLLGLQSCSVAQASSGVI